MLFRKNNLDSILVTKQQGVKSPAMDRVISLFDDRLITDAALCNVYMEYLKKDLKKPDILDTYVKNVYDVACQEYRKTL